MTTTVEDVGTIVLYNSRERPGTKLWWMDRPRGDPIDLSSGYTFVVTYRQGSTDTVITATVTANSSPSATVPTLLIEPALGQHNALTTGPATIIVVATTGGFGREGQWSAIVRT